MQDQQNQEKVGAYSADLLSLADLHKKETKKDNKWLDAPAYRDNSAMHSIQGPFLSTNIFRTEK